MSADRYTNLINTPIGRIIQKQVGLPAPVPLKRFSPGDPVVDGRVLLGGAPGGRLASALAKTVAEIGAEASTPLREDLRAAAAEAGLDAGPWTPAAAETQRYGALVFDATGITEPGQLDELHAFFKPTVRRVQRCGRLVVLGTSPAQARTPAEQIAQRALEGFTRAAAKELKAGATAQLVYVAPGAEDQLASTLRFLLSSKSAYVDGQVIHVGPAGAVPALDWEQPLAGKVALVTGASRGIGAAIAATLARDGAHVVGLDVPALESDLNAVVGALGGSSLTADITADDAPDQIAASLKREHGGVDVVVHNAGITRDKTLGRMDEERWNSVIQVNLAAVQRITDALIAGRRRAVLNEGGRIVCVASIAGIAGNFGQTNYATSKAGVIGLVDAYAPLLAQRGATINAVAPGFIETQMTAKIPFATREAGRRMNSLSQGGLPVDVAEAIAYFASPASTGVTGNTVRVCGQSLLGA
ncbi:3-oxoacyl-ACP reductase [Conexibacter sp. CPCC 206217]|uniref:3-oxoacyl-ACP reductase n=1 Tax=Conexibacter sp. CPCC 206217 TaxID=3064574 RepID=UPI00271F00B1|nr:3-oxoacyl-ACP reductase [Conexibacter sp. CPCC 206217]MDO8211306.1 3-oxoacyl-ACP reductase [Conexibacter sp. CPCC 206217]